MSAQLARIAALAILSLWLSSSASAVMIDTVPVGNPGNSPDPVNGFDDIKGAVEYLYYIGKYEVTNNQYAAFLNAKASSDPLSFYNTKMASDPNGGILRSGASGSYVYSVKNNMGNKPVNFVNWYDAMRFANWMNNGQGNSDTESGAYTLLGGTPRPSNWLQPIPRSGDATWFLTSGNEWYKAAYHQPAAQGGDVDDYWLMPTRTNSGAFTIAQANSIGDIKNPGANVMNYVGTIGGQTFSWFNGGPGVTNVSTVGSAGPLSQSYYGTFDQGGNVWEWVEEKATPDAAFAYGGSYFQHPVGGASAQFPDWAAFDFEDPRVGFRLATVPEPSSLALAVIAALALIAWIRSPKPRI
jgi:formylglycine-generating enzyme required for sulfatase activity